MDDRDEADRLQQIECADRNALDGFDWLVESDANRRLARQICKLRRSAFNRCSMLRKSLIVIDTLSWPGLQLCKELRTRLSRRGGPGDFVAFLKQKSCKVSAALPSDTTSQRFDDRTLV